MKQFTISPTWAWKCTAIMIKIVLADSLLVAQKNLTIIKARSENVNVRDGDLLKKELWNLSPERKPGIYYITGPQKEKRLTFYTDLDSISFNVKPWHNYDFIILLNNRDSCFTQIKWPSNIDTVSYKSKYPTNGLASYTGTFETEDEGLLIITVEENKLIGQPKNGKKRELSPAGQHEFYLKEQEITLTFEKNEKGEFDKIRLVQNGQTMMAKKIK